MAYKHALKTANKSRFTEKDFFFKKRRTFTLDRIIKTYSLLSKYSLINLSPSKHLQNAGQKFRDSFYIMVYIH